MPLNRKENIIDAKKLRRLVDKTKVGPVVIELKATDQRTDRFIAFNKLKESKIYMI